MLPNCCFPVVSHLRQSPVQTLPASSAEEERGHGGEREYQERDGTLHRWVAGAYVGDDCAGEVENQPDRCGDRQAVETRCRR